MTGAAHDPGMSLGPAGTGIEVRTATFDSSDDGHFRIPSTAGVPLDRMVLAGAEMAQLVHTGKRMLVVGGPAGKLMKSSGQTLGVVKGANGNIAGHLRLAPDRWTAPVVAVPAAIWQIAGALTLQRYLHTMSEQLQELQSGVSDIKAMLDSMEEGKLYAAQRFIVQHEQVLSDGKALGTDLSSACEGHLAGVRSVFSSARDHLGRTFLEATQLVDDQGRIRDHDKYDKHLSGMRGEAPQLTSRMLIAIDFVVRLLRLQQVFAVERDLGQTDALQKTAAHEVQAMRETFELLSAGLDRMIVSERAIYAHEPWYLPWNWFSTDGRVKKLREYQLETFKLREFVAQPASVLFPDPPKAVESFVIECWEDDGRLVGRAADLELTSEV